jgi:hypothetical protein
MNGAASPKLPRCPACAAGGLRPVKTLGKWFKPDGRVKQQRVKRGGRMVTRPVAWVVCQRGGIYWGRSHGTICGWGWWTAHPRLVALAEQHPARKLLRRHAKPPGHPGRRGKGIASHA